MEIEKNNNKELVPLEHYLEEYAKASPEEMKQPHRVPIRHGKTAVSGNIFRAEVRGDLAGVFGDVSG